MDNGVPCQTAGAGQHEDFTGCADHLLQQSDGFVMDGNPGITIVRLDRAAHLLQYLVFDFNRAGDHQFKVLHLMLLPH